MISVTAKYINCPNKHGTDYFIYTDIEVIGHSEKAGSYTNNIRLCAGVSACCYGMRRVLDDAQFKYECRSGYFHVSVERRKNLRQYLDKSSVYALNTLICQLYELYLEYPTSFSSFDLIDVKENYEYERKQKNFRKPRKKGMGLLAVIEGSHLEEN